MCAYSTCGLLQPQLDKYVIHGVENNVSFVRDVCTNPRYVDGALTTGFIDEEYPEGFSGVVLPSDDRLRLAATAAIMHTIKYATPCSVCLLCTDGGGGGGGGGGGLIACACVCATGRSTTSPSAVAAQHRPPALPLPLWWCRWTRTWTQSSTSKPW